MVKTLPLHEAFQTLSLPGLERNLFFSFDWFSVIDKTYRTRIFVKYIEEEGKVRSYIIYSVVKNFLEWKICICSYCDYCDCHVTSLEDWNRFLQQIKKEYSRYRIAIRSLRDDLVRQCETLNVLSKEKFHVLDTRADLDSIWKKTTDSFKNAVRQSQKQGVIVKKCDFSELKKFYRLHLAVRKNKYHLFPQPFRFFKNIWHQYMDRGQGVLLGAYDKTGKFIAGNVYLVCGNTLYYKFNTSDRNALKLRPNNILFWEGIRYAKDKGLDCIDLGSSGCEQTGLILFKDQTGAKSQDIIHLGYHPQGYQFSEKRILRLMTKVFTYPWMPNFLVRCGSSLIYPFLA